MPTRSPFIAACLSFLVPGAGQLYNHERPKGVALLCITAGIGYGVFMSTLGPPAFRSSVTAVLLAAVYLFVWFPAVIDAYQHAAGKPSSLLSGGRTWYVIFMLLTVGPMAIPLLWQSPRFSRTGKIIWTSVVIFITLLGIVFLLFVGPAVERVLRDLTQAGQPVP